MSELGVNPDSNRIAQANAMQMGGDNVAGRSFKNRFKGPQAAISDLKVESLDINFKAKLINSSQASPNEVKVSKEILVKSDSIGSHEPVKKSNEQIKSNINNLFHTVQNSKGEVSLKQVNAENKREINYKDPTRSKINELNSSLKVGNKKVCFATVEGDQIIVSVAKGKAESKNAILVPGVGIFLNQSQNEIFRNKVVVYSNNVPKKERSKIDEMFQNDAVYVVSEEQFASFIEIHNTRIKTNEGKTEKSEKEDSHQVRSLGFHAAPKQNSNGEKVKLKETEVFNKYFPVQKDLNKNQQAQNKRNAERNKEKAEVDKMEVMREAVQRQENSREEKKDNVKNDYLQQEAQA